MPVLLSDATYQRIMKVVEAYEKGELHVIPGDGLVVDEEGPGGQKLSLNSANTTAIDVCGLGTVNFITK